MITASGVTAFGVRHVVVGLSREDVDTLTDGDVLVLNADTRTNFPTGLELTIVFGESDVLIAESLKEVGGPDATEQVRPRGTRRRLKRAH